MRLPDTPGKRWGLRRLADDGGRFRMVAVDQRPPIMELARRARGESQARDDDVRSIKALLTETLAPLASAMLLDPLWAYGESIRHVSPRQGLIVTLEDHRFETVAGGRLSRRIAGWSPGRIRRIGADAVKALAWYHPGAAPEVRRAQQDWVAAIGDECRRHDIVFLFELLLYPLGDDAHGYVESPGKQAALVLESVADFADPRFGVDVFKLESPIAAASLPPPDHAGAAHVRAAFAALHAAAGRPWVMLSAGASPEQFERVLGYALEAGAGGFLAGRAIWAQALAAFPDLAAARTGLATQAAQWLSRFNALTAARARPFDAARPLD